MQSQGVLTVGLLAVQGAFVEHRSHLESLRSQQTDIRVVEIRRGDQLTADIDGLIIPGGESTTVSKFMHRNGLLDAYSNWFNNSNRRSAVWGICAGLIMLSDTVVDMKTGGQTLVRGLGVATDRNFYGRQGDSFESTIRIENEQLRAQGAEEFHGIFIRAPKILSVDSSDVVVLATHNNSPVAVRQGRILGSSFHPELTEDSRFHQYFINLILQLKSE